MLHTVLPTPVRHVPNSDATPQEKRLTSMTRHHQNKRQLNPTLVTVATTSVPPPMLEVHVQNHHPHLGRAADWSLGYPRLNASIFEGDPSSKNSSITLANSLIKGFYFSSHGMSTPRMAKMLQKRGKDDAVREKVVHQSDAMRPKPRIHNARLHRARTE